MKTLKEKQMVKVQLVKGEELKGIVLHVSENSFSILTSEFKDVIIQNKEVQSATSTRFPKAMSDMLKEMYASYKKEMTAEKEYKKQQDILKQMERDWYDAKADLREKRKELEEKRFELFGTLQDISNKMRNDLDKDNAICIYEPGNSGKCVRVGKVFADNKNIHMDITFEDMMYGGDNVEELYWLDYERYYDCSDWNKFQQKYCPNVLKLVQSVFPTAKVVEKKRDCGRGEDDKKIELNTIFTVSFAIKKENYDIEFLKISQAMKSFKNSYVLANRRNYSRSLFGF
ncbi:hypothetical protein [Bacillus cereus group sp. TH152-1LC]|uniref:hypothetical protein n=1 Tax=Bacillus cereus group sp. TH152-1LC TaxID=3018060 RepID=UPI0022E28194|nr:hypothetical protein [Bacillus cereus group sp. TH152-1LC]MDA1675306.1 hypothetical protein [Bacillus cereus group sp. TH152-1LC]